jgi:hypothetical protein
MRMEVEPLPTAAGSRRSSGWPIANRPQLAKLPHNRAGVLPP